jgi:hypothetical protein
MEHLTNLFFRSATSSTASDAQFQSKLSELKVLDLEVEDLGHIGSDILELQR